MCEPWVPSPAPKSKKEKQAVAIVYHLLLSLKEMVPRL
jgi:hypothetical protein